ncbi:hypothetical protein [Aurantimonas sp. Leaf443]|uniref:hypothetical protein n=1 Tax=Aurantimonas sp. Leaf443 TaxID=1736378 RepID=UPI0006F9B76E|nr:hypothetical protein [Aurantimonas sp. Leaf443]KQT82441.1 hypothetical protein ASG48_15310 [Aurantimonas sp. Leaf443]
MISLAQYFAERSGDDFTPFRAPAPAKAEPVAVRSLAARKPAPTGERRLATRPLKTLEAGVVEAAERPARRPAAAAKPAPAKPAPQRIAAPEQRLAEPVAVRPAFRPAPKAAPVQAEPLVSARILEEERQQFAAERAAYEAERAQMKAELDQASVSARLEGMLNGRRMAREEMQPEIETRLAAIRQELLSEHQETLARARAEWTELQADRLARHISEELAQLESVLKETFQAVLRPLALDARRRQTVDELVDAVRTIALDGQPYRINASGPADLLEEMGKRLGDRADLVSFAVDETRTEVRIDADNTVIETRLSSWQQALEEALS